MYAAEAYEKSCAVEDRSSASRPKSQNVPAYVRRDGCCAVRRRKRRSIAPHHTCDAEAVGAGAQFDPDADIGLTHLDFRQCRL